MPSEDRDGQAAPGGQHDSTAPCASCRAHPVWRPGRDGRRNRWCSLEEHRDGHCDTGERDIWRQPLPCAEAYRLAHVPGVQVSGWWAHLSALTSRRVPGICTHRSEPWGGHTTERPPTYPSLLRSIKRGATARTYVHVQIRRRMTSKRDWKLNSADYKHIARARVRLVNASRPTARTHHSRVSHLRRHCSSSKRDPYVGTSRTKACITWKAAWTW